MKVELFALCDFAADYAGKLTVVGVFDSIYARQMPAVHAHCCLAVKLRFEKIEEGAKKLRLSVADDDGRAVLPPIELAINVAMPPDAPSNAIQVVANIGGMKIDSFGEYSIDLALDGRHEGSIPLFVRQMS
jgi:hypothetical protein